MKIFSIFLIIFTTSTSYTEKNSNQNSKITQNDLKKSLIETSTKRPLINEIVAITPVPDHHFNLEAPQNCGTNSTMDPSARTLSCQYHGAGKNKILVSVCDNEKNYCKQENITIEVLSQNSKTPRLKEPMLEETKKMQSEAKSLLMKGFKAISPTEPLKALQKNKKQRILALVSTEWCPPCNTIKEFLLPHPKFKQITKDYLLVYVDGDSPNMESWSPFLGSFYYPSFVVLNSNLEAVDILTGATPLYKFQKWLQLASSNLSDPIQNLKKRMEERMDLQIGRKFKDFFSSQATLEKEQTRWLKYLKSVANFELAYRYMTFFYPQTKELEKLTLEYSNYWYGKGATQFDKKELDQKKKDIATKVLNSSFENSDSWLPSYLAFDKCSSKNRAVGTKDSQINCQSILKKVAEQSDFRYRENLNSLTEPEKVFSLIEKTLTKISIANAQGDQNSLENNSKTCNEQTQILFKMSPLLEKSRAVRFKQLGCLEHSTNSKNEDILRQLTKDYPYDSTFHRKLSQYYQKRKKYQKALQSSELAIKYSYGDSWVKSLLLQATILKDMSQKSQALALLEKNLPEITINKSQGVKKAWWLKSLRNLIKELKSS